MRDPIGAKLEHEIAEGIRKESSYLMVKKFFQLWQCPQAVDIGINTMGGVFSI
jgi:hypothetical protein